MHTLTITGIDDDLAARLRALAEKHGHSVEDEVLVILAQALPEPTSERKGMATLFREAFAEFGGVELDIPRRDSPVREIELPE